MAQQNIPLPGYTSPVGYSRKLVWAGDHFGSNNYQQGGYAVPASAFGMAAYEKLGIDFGGLTISGATPGLYQAKVFTGANIAFNTEAQAPCISSLTLRWFYPGNGAEVANNVDLSAQGIRLDVRGV